MAEMSFVFNTLKDLNTNIICGHSRASMNDYMHDSFLSLAYYPVECFKRSCLVAQLKPHPTTEIDSFFSVVAF